MQPNQQDPNISANPEAGAPQNTPTAASNVPEYLHLDPIPDSPTKKSNRKWIVIVVFLIVLLAGTGVFAAYQWMQFNSPEERFYRALDKQMQVSYVKRELDLKNENSSMTTVISTDTSDPKQTKSDMLTTASDSNKNDLNMQAVVLNSKQYYFSIKSSPKGSSLDSVKKDQWYSTPFHASGRQDIGYWINEIGSPLVLNSVQGLIPTGNFTSDQRNQLLAYMRSNDVYPILGTQAQTANGSKLTGYSIKLDLDKINALNAQVVKLLGLTQLFTIQKPYPAYQEVTIWVDDTTGRFAEITYNSGESKDGIHTKQVATFAYPNKLSIAAPSGVKEL